MLLAGRDGLLARRLKRAAVYASLSIEALVGDRAEAATLPASAGEILYLYLKTRYAVAFALFFFGH